MIIGLITTLATFFTGFFKNRHELAQEKFKTKVAIEQNRQRLAMAEETHNHEWEMASLKGTGKTLRFVSFAIFAGPFVVAIFSPEDVKNYFDVSMAAVPLWWQQTFIAIIGGIWGLSSLKNIVPAVVSIFKK